MIKQNKSTPALKTQLKKSKGVKKKQKAKLDKNRKKYKNKHRLML